MKRISLLFSLLIGTFSVTWAQQDGHNHENAPQVTVPAAAPDTLLILKEKEFDFGKIPQGKPVQHTFEFSNAGTQPMKLANVQASCGCTTPEWDKNKEVAPGASSSIRVGYNAAAEGPFNKVITITYNENQTKQINIKGEVWKTPAASAPANSAVSELKD
jgi:hypothetical protein